MGCQRVLPDVLPPGESVLSSHHIHLDPVPRLVGQSRAFVREHAPPLPQDTADILLLLTSELVTNAVLHARTPIEVGLTITDRSVLVTVHDEDLARPEQRPYENREGGWGLGLVTALAAGSDMETHPGDGKTAWFLLPRGDVAVGENGAAGRDGQADLGTAGAATEDGR